MADKEDLKDRFISIYLQNGFHISKACRLTGIERATYYHWMKNDPEFEQRVKDGKRELLDTLIEECEEVHRIGRKGIPILDNSGKFIKWKVPPDLRAVEWFLTRRAKESYGDVSEQNINVKGSISIEKWIERK